MELDSTIASILAAGVAECHAAITRHGGLLTSLFIAGLLGSMTHCVGMCGPFVIGQVVARLEARPAAEMREFHRLSGAALVPYHLGRATTYAGLGALAAALAGGLIHLTGLKWLSAALLALAAVFFAGYALQRLGMALPWAGRGGEGWWSRRIGRMVRPLFAKPVGWRGYRWALPSAFCRAGLLYGALAAAAASAGPRLRSAWDARLRGRNGSGAARGRARRPCRRTDLAAAGRPGDAGVHAAQRRGADLSGLAHGRGLRTCTQSPPTPTDR